MIDRLALLAMLLTLIWAGSRAVYEAGFRPLVVALGPASQPGRLLFHILMAPGTIVHETSHWLACKVLLVRVHEFAPYRPLRDGTMGWVLHDHPDPLRGMVIAFAPIVGGATVIGLATRLVTGSLLPFPSSANAEELVFNLMTWLPAAVASANWLDWRTWVFVYLVATVGRGMVPSPGDLAPVMAAVAAVLLSLAGLYLSRDWLTSSTPWPEVAGTIAGSVVPVIDQALSALSIAAGALVLGGGIAVGVGLAVQQASDLAARELPKRAHSTRRR